MKKNSCFQLRRLMMLLMAIALLTACMAGCSFGSGDPTDPSEPSETQGQLPSDEATDPSEDPTEPTETEPVEKSVMGTVMYNNLNVRSNASTDSTVLKQLAINSRVEVLSQKVVGDTTWGRIADGWINLYYVKLDGETEKPDDTTPDPTTAPDDKDDDKDNKDDKTDNKDDDKDSDKTTSSTSIYGTVTASELNIRKGAGTKYDSVGAYVVGDRVKILEKKDGWGRTSKGWISMKYVHVDGTTGKNTGIGYVTASSLNARSGPATKHDSNGTYKYGTRIKILEQVTVDGTTWGYTSKGWVSLKHVYVEGKKGEGAGSGIVTGDQVNIRTGPSTDYKSVGHVNKGDKVEILAQLKIGDSTWGYTSKGWISMKFVEIAKAESKS